MITGRADELPKRVYVAVFIFAFLGSINELVKILPVWRQPVFSRPRRFSCPNKIHVSWQNSAWNSESFQLFRYITESSLELFFDAKTVFTSYSHLISVCKFSGTFFPRIGLFNLTTQIAAFLHCEWKDYNLCDLHLLRRTFIDKARFEAHVFTRALLPQIG